MKEIAKVSRKLSDLLLIIFRSQLNYPTSIAQDSPSPDMQGRAQLNKMKEDAHQVYKFTNAFVFVRNSFKKKQWDLNYLSNDEKHFYAMWQPNFHSYAPSPTLLFMQRNHAVVLSGGQPLNQPAAAAVHLAQAPPAAPQEILTRIHKWSTIIRNSCLA